MAAAGELCTCIVTKKVYTDGVVAHFSGIHPVSQGDVTMQITEVRIKLMGIGSEGNERILAFGSITFDDMFVVRDLKITER